MPYHVDTSKKILNNTFVNEYETIEEFARRAITHNFKMDNIDNFNFNKFKISSLFNQSEEVKIIFSLVAFVTLELSFNALETVELSIDNAFAIS